jgi:hypothetical protein
LFSFCFVVSFLFSFKQKEKSVPFVFSSPNFRFASICFKFLVRLRSTRILQSVFSTFWTQYFPPEEACVSSSVMI